MTTAEKMGTRQAPVFRAANGQRVASFTLADPEVADRVNAFTTRVAGSKEDSIKVLKKVGIINRSGKLSKNFGG